jgi:hypothetical protein
LDVATAGQSAAVAFSAELDQRPGRSQQEERLTVRFDDGRVEEMRLHEYGRVYSVPGLYEDVVQRQLACASPSELAGALAREVEAERASLADLRVLDVGAGNGVVGEELRRHGLRAPLIGLDNEPEAGRAAERDRPGLYADYLTGGLDDFPIASLVEEHALNCLVGAGALGLGHISAASFDAAWRAFPRGSWLAITAPEEVLSADGGPLAEYVAALRKGEHGTDVRHVGRFRHRLRMSGEPIFYCAIVARRTA